MYPETMAARSGTFFVQMVFRSLSPAGGFNHRRASSTPRPGFFWFLCARVGVQYDDREVDVGGGGRGDDLETVRRVNQLVRQEEEEDAWWEDNKNTNLRSEKDGVPCRPSQGALTYHAMIVHPHLLTRRNLLVALLSHSTPSFQTQSSRDDTFS